MPRHPLIDGWCPFCSRARRPAMYAAYPGPCTHGAVIAGLTACQTRWSSRAPGEQQRLGEELGELAGGCEGKHRRDVLVGAHHDDTPSRESPRSSKMSALVQASGAAAYTFSQSVSPSGPVCGRNAPARARCRHPRSAAGRSTFTSNTASMSAPAGV